MDKEYVSRSRLFRESFLPGAYTRLRNQAYGRVVGVVSSGSALDGVDKEQLREAVLNFVNDWVSSGGAVDPTFLTAAEKKRLEIQSPSEISVTPAPLMLSCKKCKVIDFYDPRWPEDQTLSKMEARIHHRAGRSYIQCKRRECPGEMIQILQTLRSKPGARILITSETHVAVDNALDRLTGHLTESEMPLVMRYPRFNVKNLENPAAFAVQAHPRANALWAQALEAAPELTERLWQGLERGRKNDDGTEELPRWLVRNLADKHRIIGVTCNQLDHFMDKDSDMFDLAIVDECSKATMPEWLMALTVARKCVLVGDHKQLPPTFCQEESEALSELDQAQEKLIRDGVIERIFDHFPESKKGTLLKQYRMLGHIGTFISEHFYRGDLDHSRTEGNGLFEDFSWLTYNSRDYYVPPERGNGRKTLVNQREIKIIIDHLNVMFGKIGEEKLRVANLVLDAPFNDDNVSQEPSENPSQSVERQPYFTEGTKLSVAVITPYRAQCQEIKRALKHSDFTKHLTIEVDTVDAFQGRQADVVIFSFVRTVGPATFYADDRRMNVAISRARDCVYLVGSHEYIKRKNIPALMALAKRPVLSTFS